MKYLAWGEVDWFSVLWSDEDIFYEKRVKKGKVLKKESTYHISFP